MDVIYSFIDRNGSDQTLQDYQIILADAESDEGSFSLLPWEAGPVARDLGYPATPLYFQVHDMDLDADLDLMWLLDNERGTSGELTVNALAVLRGTEKVDEGIGGAGFFQTDLPTQVHLVSQDWSGYGNSAAVDLNGDGNDDVVWIHVESRRAFIAYGKPDALN